MIITPILAPTLAGLSATPTIRGNLVKWTANTDLALFSVEVWGARIQLRGTTVKLATVVDNTYMHLTDPGEIWYYWIRAVSTFGRADGPWHPVSDTAGIPSTTLLTQTTDIGADAVAKISFSQSLAAATQTAYATWETVFNFMYLGTGSTFILHLEHLHNFQLTTIGTSQSAYAMQRMILVENSYQNTGTATVTNGSAIVTGVGTVWLSTIAAGQLFFIVGGARYTILSVNSNTQLTLTAPYAGSTLAGQSFYVITSSFTAFTLAQTTDLYTINGSYCLHHSYPFNYRLPVGSSTTKFYDVFLDWALIRDNTSWAISNQAGLRTLILEEIKR